MGELTKREDRFDLTETARRSVMPWAARATLVAGVFLFLGAWLMAVFEMAILFLSGQLLWVDWCRHPREGRLVVGRALFTWSGPDAPR